MKRYGLLALAVTIALALVVALTSGASKAQDPVGQVAGAASSAPVPPEAYLASPPDASTDNDPLDFAPAQYDSYLRIAGSAVKPRESGVEWTGSGGGGCMYVSSGSTYAVFNTPVYLPQGATVKYLRMYYYDANASFNSSAWFTVYDLYGTIVEEHGVSSSGSTGNGYETTAEFTHTIDYLSYSYVINWRPYDLGSDTQVCGFRIYYDSPSGAVFLPLVNKESD